MVLDRFSSFLTLANIAFLLSEKTFNVHSHARNTESKNTLQFVLKHDSANIWRLECQRSINIARISFRKTFVSTPVHVKEFLPPFHEWCHGSLFSIQFIKLKRYAHIYSISLASCKIGILNSNGNYFRQKQKIFTAKIFNSKLLSSKGI